MIEETIKSVGFVHEMLINVLFIDFSEYNYASISDYTLKLRAFKALMLHAL